jgi:hypothetical protein
MPAHRTGGRPLDPNRTDPDAATGGSTPPEDREVPRGIREQLQATRDAFMRVVRAHVDLARAETDAIKGEVSRAAALGGLALGLVILLAFLLPIGLTLFLGEWIFGSIGWGVLLGTELLVAVTVLLVLAALRVPGLGVDLLIAGVIGVIASIVLGANAANELWRRFGEAANLGEPAWRPLVVGIIAGAVLGAVVGLVAGARPGGAGAAIGGLVAGAILGAVLGAFLAITFGWRVGAAVGVGIGLLAWTTLMGMRVARQGIDGEALKARYWPQATIDTTKETLEWAKARVPFGPKT